MNFKLTPEEEAFRKEVHDFLQKESTPELTEELNSGLGLGPLGWQFIHKLGKRGWLIPTLPKQYGGLDASYFHRFIILDECAYFFPEWLMLFGAHIVAPVLMKVGSEEQKKEYLPRIARGDIEFCIGYTEPEAGSDLANINMRAIEQDDCYLINGQKTFNTGCHYAQYHWLCARTEVTERKHRGLSLFIVPLDSQGITINPMWGVAGERTNEVFYDNVKVPKSNLVGEKNRGFYYMMAALEHERTFPVGHLHRALEDLARYARETKRNGKFLAQDPLVRHKLAELATEVEVAWGLAYHVAWLVDSGKPSDYEGPIGKVFITELEQRLSYTGLCIMGLHGTLDQKSEYSSSTTGWLEHWFLSYARRTISAGANEIQRSIIAQRGLGLPRD